MAVADEAPGWDAIEGAFSALYPGQKPAHWGTSLESRALLGGPEALDGISAYTASDPVPHRHWVTFGLTELYTKDADDPDWSGWGYELTMRARPDVLWPLEALRKIANWAHKTRTVLRAGERMNVGAPLDPSQPCALTGWAVLADPALPAIDTPHGRVAFLQVVALHQEELDRWPESLAAIERHFAADLNDLDRAPVH